MPSAAMWPPYSCGSASFTNKAPGAGWFWFFDSGWFFSLVGSFEGAQRRNSLRSLFCGHSERARVKFFRHSEGANGDRRIPRLVPPGKRQRTALPLTGGFHGLRPLNDGDFWFPRPLCPHPLPTITTAPCNALTTTHVIQRERSDRRIPPMVPPGKRQRTLPPLTGGFHGLRPLNDGDLNPPLPLCRAPPQNLPVEKAAKRQNSLVIARRIWYYIL